MIDSKTRIDLLNLAKNILSEKHAPRKDKHNIDKAGSGLEQRAKRQGGGNQFRSPSTYTEELVRKAIKNKDKKLDPGKTLTGQKANPIVIRPVKTGMIGYH